MDDLMSLRLPLIFRNTSKIDDLDGSFLWSGMDDLDGLSIGRDIIRASDLVSTNNFGKASLQ